MKNPMNNHENLDRGVVASLPELVALRAASRGVDLSAKGQVRTHLAGPYRSPYRGRGMEFAEVRAYQHGDDVRTIDWRVTARTGRVYSKLFHEEREQPVLVLADAGPSMRFGSRECFKSVAAARAAAAICWAALDAGDRVGGLVLSPGGVSEHRPQGRRRRALSFLDALRRATQDAVGGGTRLSTALARLRRRARPGSKVFIVSDFYDLDDDVCTHLSWLARRCELTLVLVYDALERSPPPPGRYRVSDGNEVSTLDVGARRKANQYQARFDQRRDVLAELCRRHRVPLVALATDDDPSDVLPRRRNRKAKR
jgi:uncharacterized protein (DUF58 family)